jgi:glycogen debranching enzyme
MINPLQQEGIVNIVKDHLVTIFGLRTLASDDPQYKGLYIGNYNRDLAYHNGMVWPWLLGSFITAFLKTKNHEPRWRKYAFSQFVEPMMKVFGDQWDGSIPEIFDGDPPYLPRGCITQAWSVAEILRAWIEDIEGITPPFYSMVSSEIRV